MAIEMVKVEGNLRHLVGEENKEAKRAEDWDLRNTEMN